jgi:hypothetical protein
VEIAMQQYWFKPKTYGYGATPVTWEGWAFMIGYLVFIVAMSVALLANQPGVEAWLTWIAVLVPATIAITLLARQKTEGEWRWRWGRKNSRNAS